LGNTNGAGETKDAGHLREILQVLSRSGAFETQQQQQTPRVVDVHTNGIVDAIEIVEGEVL
jgi:hypothetical protein